MQKILELRTFLRKHKNRAPISIGLSMTAWTILNIGYYDTHWAEDNKTVFFIKKEMTPQIRFENLFATD